MTRPLQIARPELKGARALSPMELNAVKFTDRHTLLTPELLEKMKPASAAGSGGAGKSAE